MSDADDFPSKDRARLLDASRKMQLASIYRDADQRDILRVTLAQVMAVDTFLVGYYLPGDRIVYQYAFDDGKQTSPSQHHFGPAGICSWILRNRRTYTWEHDGGGLIHGGYLFGNTDKTARDAIVAPLLGTSAHGTQTVLGHVAVHSYEQHSYDADSIAAVEWLCRSLVTADRLGQEDSERARELGVEASPTQPTTGLSNALDHVLAAVGRTLDRLLEAPESEPTAELIGVLQRSQSDLAGLFLAVGPHAGRVAQLTPRERQVADLAAQGRTNAEIAGELFITVPTVKSHISRVLSKLDLRQRSEIRMLMWSVE